MKSENVKAISKISRRLHPRVQLTLDIHSRETSDVYVTAWYIMIGGSTALYRCLHTSAPALGNNFISSTNVIHPKHAMSWRVDVVAVQFSKGGKLEEIRVYRHAVTADNE